MDRELNQKVGDISGSSDAAVAIGDGEIAELDGSSPKKAAREGEEEKRKGDDKCSSFVIDIDSKDLVGENQRLCRICHLSAKEISGQSSAELMELGCGCKGELGVAHLHCAEAWFRVRGNRLCEICGENAKNITSGGDTGLFMEQWSERRYIYAAGSAGSSHESRRGLRRQRLCNILMACLIIAFVLPWFLRVSLF